jgi:elongation factor P--(R)-beta-lysine ligase
MGNMLRVQKSNLLYEFQAAPLKNLQVRALILNRVRAFFSTRSILEVETPILSHSTVTSPYIHSLETIVAREKPQRFFLQTSPEFAMKRLLALGYGDIFQITKSFRDGEVGQKHNPEFTLLEWYRVGMRYFELMEEVDNLLQAVIDTQPAKKLTYRDLYQQYLHLDPFVASRQQLLDSFDSVTLASLDHNDLDQDTLLDLLMSTQIEPHLGTENTPVFVYDFPASQAALANIRQDAIPVAERFEVYLNQMELANGFDELTDAQEQRQRFIQENEIRRNKKLPEIPLDHFFLTALEQGLPACSGVALGIDRLVMAFLRTQKIDEVMAFTIDKA